MVGVPLKDLFFVKVSLTKDGMHFGKWDKLSQRFMGPFEVLRQVGVVAYKLPLPPNLLAVHPIFHVSTLKKMCRMDHSSFRMRSLTSDPTYPWRRRLHRVLTGL